MYLFHPVCTFSVIQVLLTPAPFVKNKWTSLLGSWRSFISSSKSFLNCHKHFLFPEVLLIFEKVRKVCFPLFLFHYFLLLKIYFGLSMPSLERTVDRVRDGKERMWKDMQQMTEVRLEPSTSSEHGTLNITARLLTRPVSTICLNHGMHFYSCCLTIHIILTL